MKESNVALHKPKKSSTGIKVCVHTPSKTFNFHANSLEKELPCLSMQTYTFDRSEIKKRKKEITKNLQRARSLIYKELNTLAEENETVKKSL